MQIKIMFHGEDGKITLPLSYQYIVQSTIYHWLSINRSLSAHIHEEGSRYEERKFKMFTFGALKGKYTVSGKEIIFHGNVELEIRSINHDIIHTLEKAFDMDEFTLGGNKCEIRKVKITNYQIEDRKLYIKMLSPITVYETNQETKKTKYFTPEEEDFYIYIYDNFYRKYKAFYGIFPEEKVELKKRTVNHQDKMVTRYKGLYITGWRGIYELNGEAEYLNFLYHTGLGSKNSQGFGMFEIISS